MPSSALARTGDAAILYIPMTGIRMQPPKDSLFAAALALVLGGTALLFRTTGALSGFGLFWPISVAAVGCLIVYVGATRRLAAPWLFAGTAGVLTGRCFWPGTSSAGLCPITGRS